MKNFIEPEGLKDLKEYIILDLRKDKVDYEKDHLEKAYYFNLDEDLSDVPDENTGKHPLPKRKVFEDKLRKTGAGNDSVFVLYDGGDNYSAPRGWFVLKYFGVDNVYVLHGGYKKALEYGLKKTDSVPSEKNGDITLSEGNLPTVDYEVILEHSINPIKDTILVDSRANERFLGNVEPLYDVAGHIPNSKNIFYMDPYKEDGTLKSLEELKSIFKKTEGFNNIILSCGSGVSACANFIAMDEIGMEPKLYVGSYSQWLKKGNEVAKGEE